MKKLQVKFQRSYDSVRMKETGEEIRTDFSKKVNFEMILNV